MYHRWNLYLSMRGELTAADARPTKISRAPAMPASSSLKPYGSRNWLRRLLKALKKPTRTLKAKKIK